MRKLSIVKLACAIVTGAAALAAPPLAGAAGVVFSDSGAQVGDLTGAGDALTLFRAALGNNNGAAPTPGVTTGRREINWDAPGPLDAAADPAFMPGNQFNGLAAPFARGAQFSTPGAGFFVSRRCAQDAAAFPCGGSNILFGMGPGAGNDVNFRAFSEERIFTPVGSNLMDVTFAVPGSPGTAATVSAFGAIFLDVEAANLTSMTFFDEFDVSLGTYLVDASVDSGFSFLGVQFNAGERIGRVRLSLGDMTINGHGSFSALQTDLVALDDFIYSEPLAANRVPEPASLALVGVALLAMQRRRLKAGA